MTNEASPDNGQSNLSTTPSEPAARSGGRRRGAKAKRAEVVEETAPLTVSLPKGMVRQIKIVVAAGDHSTSEWLADVLRPVLRREVAKLISSMEGGSDPG